MVLLINVVFMLRCSTDDVHWRCDH